MLENNFAGFWILVPELCLYQQGDVPVSGDYRIDCDGNCVKITMHWTDMTGRDQSAIYSGLDDGSKKALEAPGITHFSITRVDANTLDSAAFKNDQEVMYARRVISQKGDLMSTVQTTRSEPGDFTNFQVYRRQNS